MADTLMYIYQPKILKTCVRILTDFVIRDLLAPTKLNCVEF